MQAFPITNQSGKGRIVSSSPRTGNRIGIILLVAVFLGLPTLAGLLVDYWWFVDLGQREVFVTSVTSFAAMGLLFGSVAFVLLFINARLARKFAPRVVIASAENATPQLEELISSVRQRAMPIIDKAILWGSLAFGLLMGLSMAPSWDVVRLAMAAQPFGATDPLFGREIAFFVFELPLLRLLASWLTPILIFVTLVTAFIHLVGGAIQPLAGFRRFAPHVKAHLSVLLGLIVASKAFDYYVSIYELNFSPRGQVTGASYTDIHAQLPAYQILIAISAVTALALLVNIWIKGWKLPAAAVGVWLVAAILVGGVYPEIIQRFRVNPNELSAEEPYIRRNIEATRKAFGLDTVETLEFPADQALTAEDVQENRDTLDNLRLWDPEVIVQSFRQLQIIRQYYTFNDVDVDRYEIGGRQRQVLVSARELDVNLLDPKAQTWVNRHLIYTHGYGLVMSPSNEADGRGFPNFFISDIPPRSSVEVTLTRPGIYFGESTDDYIIVDTSLPEFAFPMGDENAETFWEGTDGIELDSLFRRAVFALRFGASQILFSQYIQPDSRVLFDRDIVTRVEKLAPWLALDGDPYPIIHEGRILWILDGYTYTSHYPYSQHYNGINYIRNSVKITVDAYDGTTRLYAFDPEEPILAAWRQIMPDLIFDAAEIPEGIRPHFRYPQDIFLIRAEVYKRYHMTNVRVFYNKEDLWEFPGEGTPNGAMRPFYVLGRLPGEEEENFQMIMPFTPRGRDNMIGWMATSSDARNYGKTVVYEFPKDRVMLGPDQIRARINQDDAISPQLTLWGQRGSEVLFGSMLVIPLEGSVIYIQPLYLQAEQASIPELTRVLVVYGDRIEMAETLDSALLAAFGEAAPDPGEAQDDPAVVVDAVLARDIFERAIAKQREGDWAGYGRLIEELGSVLSRLTETAAVEATETP